MIWSKIYFSVSAFDYSLWSWSINTRSRMNVLFIIIYRIGHNSISSLCHTGGDASGQSFTGQKSVAAVILVGLGSCYVGAVGHCLLRNSNNYFFLTIFLSLFSNRLTLTILRYLYGINKSIKLFHLFNSTFTLLSLITSWNDMSSTL